MAILGRRVVLALAALAAGCDLTRATTPLELTGETVSVHSLLRARSDTVAVWLTRTLAGTGEDGPALEPISGAQVRIAGPGGSVYLAEVSGAVGPCGPVYWDGSHSSDRPGAGCYGAIFPGGIEAGTRYELLIVLPSGDTIRGATVVPEAPFLLAPENHTRIEVPAWSSSLPEKLEVRWRRDPEARSVRPGPSLVAERVFERGAAQPDAFCQVMAWPDGDPIGTTELRVELEIYWANCYRPPTEDSPPVAIDWDSMHVTLRVPACDTACARYQEQVANQRYAPEDRASAGLTGAYGLFGGLVLAERSMVFVRKR